MHGFRVAVGYAKWDPPLEFAVETAFHENDLLQVNILCRIDILKIVFVVALFDVI
jgi:hypothetical protein